MYIVTFYSFKGGVGRTMAMANVALSLAKAGRRVLLVDFDLEAPGLDTFDLLRPSAPTPGLVDFVSEYRTTRIAPDIAKFVYEPSHPHLDAKIWVMPTGKQDAEYGSRLNSIDWQQLYSEEDGYLLFEDLKEQWSRVIHPDYVFIDSRTGHTDVGGICTRQLPDAVALLFYPNEQNRRGMEVVVRDINRESEESGRSIKTYFVAANVPDLDDEHSILSAEIGKFERIMQQRLPDATIHHYDNLSLLQQTIFTIEHPTTKLAREYQRLATIITSSNLDDRSVVIEFLESLPQGRGSRPRRGDWPILVDERFKEIKRRYAADGVVLYALGNAHRSLGRNKEADALFAEAARLGFLSEENMADEAAKEYSAGARESARKLVSKALDLTVRRVFPVARLLSVVRSHDIEFLSEVLRQLDAKGIDAEDRIYIASQLEVDRRALPAVADFVRPLVGTAHPMQASARNELLLCLIGQKQFEEAEALILSGDRSASDLDISDSFNYAMANWGRKGTAQRDLFLRVVTLDQELPRPGSGANYFQCLAISNWAVGRNEVARHLTAKSRSAMNGTNVEFSAWRYLRVLKAEFIQDLDLLAAMIATGEGQPAILSAD
jgi:MinD-like ATPase involved in chromosome partitioning or flagellar assembly